MPSPVAPSNNSLERTAARRVRGVLKNGFPALAAAEGTVLEIAEEEIGKIGKAFVRNHVNGRMSGKALRVSRWAMGFASNHPAQHRDECPLQKLQALKGVFG